MQAKVILNQPLTQDRYGLHFVKGEAHCDNEYIINKLKDKGIKVENIDEVKSPKEVDMKNMKVEDLLKVANQKGIEISKGSKKADIITLLNIKSTDEGYNDDVKNNDNNGTSSESNSNSEKLPEDKDNLRETE